MTLALLKHIMEEDCTAYWSDRELAVLLKGINQHVAEVIGEYDPQFPIMATENALKAKQRKRAGL